NEFLTEWLEKEPWIPVEGAKGGAETLYPEYKAKLSGSTTAGANAAKPVAAPFSKPAFSPDRDVAAQSPKDGEVHVMPVQGNVYMLIADGTNITASIGPNGFLLVDAGSAKMTDKI